MRARWPDAVCGVMCFVLGLLFFREYADAASVEDAEAPEGSGA